MNLARRLQVSGEENIPDGPAVFTPNHSTVFDPLYLVLGYYGVKREPLRFLAKKGYFEGGGIDDKGKFGNVVKYIVNATGQIPVDRGKSRNSDALDEAVQALEEDGHAVGIFPEGTLVEPGLQARFRTGAAQIALRAHVPLVPVAIVPDRDASGRLKRDRWLSTVNVIFGKPVEYSEYTQGLRNFLPNALKAKLVTDELEVSVAALTGYTKTSKFATPGELRRRRHG